MIYKPSKFQARKSFPATLIVIPFRFQVSLAFFREATQYPQYYNLIKKYMPPLFVMSIDVDCRL